MTSIPQAQPERIDGGDVVIVGGGIAGLFCALKLAPRPVTLLTRSALGDMASSTLAQGGIAAALGRDDSPELHAQDTMAAAAGTADAEAVIRLTREAPQRIADLIALGAPFDRAPDGALALGREAAHSAQRIVHVGGDRSGAGVMAALIRAVRATHSIRVVEQCEVLDLALSDGHVVGVHARRDGGEPVLFAAPSVVLATGGIGQLYRVTTNPAGLYGSGIAMAARAGAVLADLEFVQFHPTAIAVGTDPAPLATEALRGAGAVLIDSRGERFMPAIHEWAELAPRDVVARAIWRQHRSGRGAFLDARAAVGEAFPERFPAVYALCREAGIDPVRRPIPVAPAAHYHMGGVATDLSGRTSVPGLWACGEVASTGIHGANRLASNSLLEGLVFGARVADDIRAVAGDVHPPRWTVASGTDMERHGRVMENRKNSMERHEDASAPLTARLRRVMSDHVGVVRDGAGLEAALLELTELERAGAPLSSAFADAVLTAKLVAAAAWLRRESRGGHFREDYPTPGPVATRSFLTLADAEVLWAEVEPVRPRRLVHA